MDEKLFSRLVDSAKSKGFDTNNLIKTHHKTG